MIDVTGHFRVCITGPRGSREHSFHNVVLDQALTELCERLLGDDAWEMGRYLFLGTGETEPSASDTGLEQRSSLPAKASSSQTFTNYSDSPKGVRQADVQLMFEYAQGEATGEWTELGLAEDADYQLPFNRSLVRDDSGTPTSLIIMSDESATIYVTLRLTDGVRFARPHTVQILGQSRPCELVPIDSGLWKAGNDGPWLEGFAHKNASLRTFGGDRVEYITPPWPAENPNQQAEPSVSKSYDREARRRDFTIKIGASREDVPFAIIRFYGASVGYELRFPQSVVKPADQALTLSFSITLM